MNSEAQIFPVKMYSWNWNMLCAKSHTGYVTLNMNIRRHNIWKSVLQKLIKCWHVESNINFLQVRYYVNMYVSNLFFETIVSKIFIWIDWIYLIILYISMNALPACISIHLICAWWPPEARECPGTGVTDLLQAF